MAAAGPEPISPELVLVCPELRAQAIALLPEFSWQTLVAQARARSAREAPESIVGARGLRDVRRTVVEMAGPLPWALAWFVSGTLGTLTMTLIADATR
jgi:hypothetical protein